MGSDHNWVCTPSTACVWNTKSIVALHQNSVKYMEQLDALLSRMCHVCFHCHNEEFLPQCKIRAEEQIHETGQAFSLFCSRAFRVRLKWLTSYQLMSWFIAECGREEQPGSCVKLNVMVHATVPTEPFFWSHPRCWSISACLWQVAMKMLPTT